MNAIIEKQKNKMEHFICVVVEQNWSEFKIAWVLTDEEFENPNNEIAIITYEIPTLEEFMRYLNLEGSATKTNPSLRQMMQRYDAKNRQNPSLKWIVDGYCDDVTIHHYDQEYDLIASNEQKGQTTTSGLRSVIVHTTHEILNT